MLVIKLFKGTSCNYPFCIYKRLFELILFKYRKYEGRGEKESLRTPPLLPRIFLLNYRSIFSQWNISNHLIEWPLLRMFIGNSPPPLLLIAVSRKDSSRWYNFLRLYEAFCEILKPDTFQIIIPQVLLACHCFTSPGQNFPC